MNQDAASDIDAVNISNRAVWPNCHHLLVQPKSPSRATSIVCQWFADRGIAARLKPAEYRNDGHDRRAAARPPCRKSANSAGPDAVLMWKGISPHLGTDQWPPRLPSNRWSMTVGTSVPQSIDQYSARFCRRGIQRHGIGLSDCRSARGTALGYRGPGSDRLPFGMSAWSPARGLRYGQRKCQAQARPR